MRDRSIETDTLSKKKLIQCIKKYKNKYFDDPELLIALNSTGGIRTYNSCSGHLSSRNRHEYKYGYISFDLNPAIVRKVKLLFRKLYRYCDRKLYCHCRSKSEKTNCKNWCHEQLKLRYYHHCGYHLMAAPNLRWNYKRYNKVREILLQLGEGRRRKWT